MTQDKRYEWLAMQKLVEGHETPQRLRRAHCFCIVNMDDLREIFWSEREALASDVPALFVSENLTN